MAIPLNRRQDDTSRMTGDCHVRFCEGLGVKFPRATRLSAFRCFYFLKHGPSKGKPKIRRGVLKGFYLPRDGNV